MKKCPYCAEEIQDEAIICRYCGRDLVAQTPPTIPMKKCPYCAEEIKEDAIVCRYCGRDLIAENVAESEVKPEPQSEVKSEAHLELEQKKKRNKRDWAWSISLGLLLGILAGYTPYLDMVKNGEPLFSPAGSLTNFYMHVITSWVIYTAIVRIIIGIWRWISRQKNKAAILIPLFTILTFILLILITFFTKGV